MAASTSFRLSDAARRRLTETADRLGTSASALLERLIHEGVDALEHPGITYRGPVHDRRAGVAGGPDVWEVVGRLQELRGPEERRIATLAEEIQVHARLVRVALDFAAANPDAVQEHIARNKEAAVASSAAAEGRAALLA